MSQLILILSGPTHEYIDPVRFIGNASSGLMGKAIAEEAQVQGFDVRFITGPVPDSHLPVLNHAEDIIQVVSAADMLAQATLLMPKAHAVIFAAAVADYTPAEFITEKMAKSDDDLTLHLKATVDIAKKLSESKQPGQITIGFALQTKDAEEHARNKLNRKNLDGIVLNSPASLGAKTGTFSYLSAHAEKFEHWGCISKTNCARQIVQQIRLLSHER